MKLDSRLMFPHLAVTDQAALFAHVAQVLLEAGLVHERYLEALTTRESAYPTGILVKGGGVALPHTDASHANGDTVAIVTLDQPIPFEPMGAPGEDPIEVTTVAFLVLSDGQAHLQALSGTVKALQDADFIAQLHAAGTAEELQDVYSQRLGA